MATLREDADTKDMLESEKFSDHTSIDFSLEFVDEKALAEKAEAVALQVWSQNYRYVGSL